MDFDLFMERYGYKILLAIFVLVVLGLFGMFFGAVFAVFKVYGLELGLGLLMFAAVYAFTVKRRYLQSYGDAMGKYFYDSKQGKRP